MCTYDVCVCVCVHVCVCRFLSPKNGPDSVHPSMLINMDLSASYLIVADSKRKVRDVEAIRLSKQTFTLILLLLLFFFPSGILYLTIDDGFGFG